MNAAHRLLALAGGLMLSAPAQAASTPIKALITGSGGQIRLSQKIFVVRKQTAEGTPLDLGVAVHQQVGGRIQNLGLFAFREHLRASELDLLIANTSRVATRCFNISPERLNAVAAWLTRQNREALRDVQTSFGPMQLSFIRDIDEDGDYYTAVFMARLGYPGLDPWVNYCTPPT